MSAQFQGFDTKLFTTQKLSFLAPLEILQLSFKEQNTVDYFCQSEQYSEKRSQNKFLYQV